MIDIHCHVLPGVDDGAATLEESLAMVRMAAEEGITDIVATPHTEDGVYSNSAFEVINSVKILQQAVDIHNIPVRIHPGSEVHVHINLLENICFSRVLTLKNMGRYILLELPVQTIPPFTEDLIHDLRANGLTPIIAHPERNALLREQPVRLAQLIRLGAIAQITAGSLTGAIGKRIRQSAEYMVRNWLVQLVASDAHSTHRRPPGLTGAYQVISRLVPKEGVSLFQSNASAVLRGETCTVLTPRVSTDWKKYFWFF
ncbi:tyrosine-protein phosphatase [Effusibacillus lacus]|uniref:Tyrosine-protein phosphatase n=1 Tax=Effusibacillus lacus TaxID=1348429 RepID=A0A292YLP1_9BACL|nr:CpsB/CapC family capsule biosynthesis tyrosine phosphatase [Effusibacillus lacus]TCS70823.1 protein-tyrosine phosphatase [Effusibacillus lacus]GAX89380.1 tyrosine protein phosphatase [Effusibacillus lacus]